MIPGTGEMSGPDLFWKYPYLDACNLGGDGRQDILVAHSDTLGKHWLSVLSSADGTPQFSIPMPYRGKGHRYSDWPGLTDLDGDGVRDFLFWFPQKGIAVPQQPAELRAYSGRDGRMLWSGSPVVLEPPGNVWPIRPVPAEGHGHPLWLVPAVGDLDGDGVPEIVVAIHKGYDEASRQYPCELLVINGRNGKLKWKWKWQVAELGFLPPLLVDVDGKGRRDIYLLIKEQQSHNMIMLNAAGQVRQRKPLPVAGHTRTWWNVDLNGDGRDKLLLTDTERIWAYDPAEEKVMWEWSWSRSPRKVIEVQPAGNGQSATVVVWQGRTIYGLSGVTGRPRWRCEAMERYNPGLSPQHALVTLLADDPQGLPRLLLQGPSDAFPRQFTVARQAWTSTPAGEYQPPAPAPRIYSPVELNWSRPLPWAGVRFSWPTMLWLTPFLGLLVAFACTRRWRELGKLLAFTVVITMLAAVGVLWLDSTWNRDPEQTYSWNGWYWIGIWVATGLGILVLVMISILFGIKLAWRGVRRVIWRATSS
jgi:hypothetical protein